MDRSLTGLPNGLWRMLLVLLDDKALWVVCSRSTCMRGVLLEEPLRLLTWLCRRRMSNITEVCEMGKCSQVFSIIWTQRQKNDPTFFKKSHRRWLGVMMSRRWNRSNEANDCCNCLLHAFKQSSSNPKQIERDFFVTVAIGVLVWNNFCQLINIVLFA